jgi:hypothetical protein
VRLRRPSTSHAVPAERRTIDPEDEARAGPEAVEQPEVQTDD